MMVFNDVFILSTITNLPAELCAEVVFKGETRGLKSNKSYGFPIQSVEVDGGITGA